MENSRFLSIEKQEFLGQEQINNKTIFVVSKTLSFSVVIKSEALELKGSKLSAALYYDSDDVGSAYKPVDRVKVEPLTFRSYVHADGKHATFEIRIVALTSQHEDALFRIQFVLVDSTKTEHKIFSEPIRVVSKPSLVNKRKRAFEEMTEDTGARPSFSSPFKSCKQQVSPVLTPVELSTTNKENVAPSSPSNDSILTTLKRIEEQQQNLMTQMSFSTFRPSFETAFQLFVEAFHSLPPEERAPKLRKVVKSCGPQREAMDELVDSYTRETVSSPSFLPSFHVSSPLSSADEDLVLHGVLDQLGWLPSEVGF